MTKPKTGAGMRAKSTGREGEIVAHLDDKGHFKNRVTRCIDETLHSEVLRDDRCLGLVTEDDLC